MLRLIDSCKNKVSAHQYHKTISRAQVMSSSRSRVFFFKLAADPILVSLLDRGLNLGYYAGGEGENTCKCKFQRKLTSGALFTFLPTR